MTHRRTQQLTLLSLALVVLLCPAGFAHAGAVSGLINSFVDAVFGTLMGLGGWLLDLAATKYMVGFGKEFSGAIGNEVTRSWEIVRDLFNLTFIFGLIYIGFKMILNSDDSQTKRWLIYLIMAALLVNFSLFISKFVVEITNRLAAEIALEAFPGQATGEVEISRKFNDSMLIGSVMDADGKGGGVLGSSTEWTMIFGKLIVYLVGMFVFAAGGILLLIRFAVLCILMIFSPVMFLGWIFPSMRGFTSRYWKAFLGRAFFAPIYMLMLYFSYQMLASFGGGGSMGKFLEESQKTPQEFSTTFTPFILASIFLIASLVIAQKLGADGAKTAVNIGKNLSNRTRRGLKAQTIDRAGKYAGYGAGKLTEAGINRLQRRGGMLGGIARWQSVDRLAREGANKMKSYKGGLSTTVEQDITRQKAINKRYKTQQTLEEGKRAKAQPGGEYDRATKIYDPATGRIVDKASLGATALAAAEAVQGKRDKAIADSEKVAGKMSNKELVELAKVDPETFESVVSGVKASQFEKLMDNDDLSDTAKGKALKARQAAISSQFETTIINQGQKIKEIVTENLHNASIEQIETMGADFVEENAHLFSQDQIDKVLKSNKFTETSKGRVVGRRKTNQVSIADGTTPNADVKQLFYHNTKTEPRLYTKRKKPNDIAALPFDVFMRNQDALKEIDIAVLEAIVNKKTMDASQRMQLKSALTNTPGVDPNLLNYMNSPQGVRHWS